VERVIHRGMLRERSQSAARVNGLEANVGPVNPLKYSTRSGILFIFEYYEDTKIYGGLEENEN